MHLTVNGESRTFPVAPAAFSVAALVEQLGLTGKRIKKEKN